MSGIIIEGVCAVGKSMVFQGLSTIPGYLEKQNKIQFSEHLTERIIENINPSLQQRVDLLSSYVDYFSLIHNNFHQSRFKNTVFKDIVPCYLIERFHLTHAVETSDFESFRLIDSRLTDLDFKLLVLKMDESVIRDRIEDTFIRRPKTWYNYVMSFGGLEGACRRYIEMQKRLLEFAEHSSLDTYIVDTTAMEWGKYIDRAEKIWGLL